MSNLNRLRELAGLSAIIEEKPLKLATDASIADDSANVSEIEDEPSSEDTDGDGTVSPAESSNVQTASADIAKAKIHIKNIQKLAETIKTDIGKYTIKIEKYINDEFGGISALSEIDKESATKIMNYFTKLHAIANGK